MHVTSVARCLPPKRPRFARNLIIFEPPPTNNLPCFAVRLLQEKKDYNGQRENMIEYRLGTRSFQEIERPQVITFLYETQGQSVDRHALEQVSDGEDDNEGGEE